MQDILLQIGLEDIPQGVETLIPLILSVNGAFEYKEYTKTEQVLEDFEKDSPEYIGAKTIWEQRLASNSPGMVSTVAVFGVDSESTPEEITEALDELRGTNDEWYFLLVQTDDVVFAEALAEWADKTVLTRDQLEAGAEEAEKLLFIKTENNSLLTAKIKECKQVVIVFHDDPQRLLHAAWVGRCAAYYPRSVTWKWKAVYNAKPANIGSDEKHRLLESGYNLYIKNHGRMYMSEGICTNGQYIDTVVSRWYIKLQMRKNEADLFVDNDDIPYDNNGFVQVASAYISALDNAAELGIILEQDGVPAYTVTIPTREDATQTQTATRRMPPTYWRATLRGSVHGIEIEGWMTSSLVLSEQEV